MNLNWCPNCGIKLETYPLNENFQISRYPKCKEHFKLNMQDGQWTSIDNLTDNQFKYLKQESEEG